MRIVPINKAEAIFETFHNVTDTEGRLALYNVSCNDPQPSAGIRDNWHAATMHLDTPGAVLTMQRDCKLHIAGYDVLRLFAAMPSALHLRVEAVIDGEPRVLADAMPGKDTTCEYDMELSGEWMTSLTLQYTLVGDRPAQSQLHWLGLSNKEKQAAMEQEESPYDAEWEEMLKKDGEFKPRMGIWFDEAELQALRRKLKEGYLSEMFSRLRAQAEKDMEIEPEKEIDTYIGNPDRRWVRDRDMKKHNTSSAMERLAFVGLIDENLEMSRMAVRMALSAAHCTYWCESIMGVFPGSTWHHRSFTEEVYCHGCTAVLDWAGHFLTEYGRRVIRDAIIMKGLPRIESDFKRHEYIRYMNQGIVFSHGRITGLLGVADKYPRYKTIIDEAEKDLFDMIEAYVLPDGGVSEGPSYWHYTVSNVMPLLFVLARFRGVAMKDMVSEPVLRTARFARQMLSIQAPGATPICTNDAHMDNPFTPGLLASLWQLTGEEEYRQILSDALYGNPEGTVPNINFLIMAPDELEKTPRYVPDGLESMNITGQTHIVRKGKSALVNLHLVSGEATSGHYHEDKGSFVLETEHETLAMDRGVTTYSHPETKTIQQADVHNLLLPEVKGVVGRQHADDSAKVLDVKFENGLFCYATDTTGAWDDGVYDKCVRRVVSPCADVYLVDDEAACPVPTVLHFTVNSTYAAEPAGKGLRILGKKNDLYVCPVNWTPAAVTHGVHGIDSHEHPAQRMRLSTGEVTSARLLTALVVLEKGEAVPEDMGVCAETAPGTLRVQWGEKSASFADGAWTIG